MATTRIRYRWRLLPRPRRLMAAGRWHRHQQMPSTTTPGGLQEVIDAKLAQLDAEERWQVCKHCNDAMMSSLASKGCQLSFGVGLDNVKYFNREIAALAYLENTFMKHGTLCLCFHRFSIGCIVLITACWFSARVCALCLSLGFMKELVGDTSSHTQTIKHCRSLSENIFRIRFRFRFAMWWQIILKISFSVRWAPWWTL